MERQAIVRHLFKSLVVLFPAFCTSLLVVPYHQSLFILLGLGLLHTFIFKPLRTRVAAVGRLVDLLLIAVVLVSTVYFTANFYTIATERVSMLNRFETILACLAILAILEATRREAGMILVLIGVLALVYARYGYLFPELISHRGISAARIGYQQFFTLEGVFSAVLGVLFKYACFFMILGGILQATGISDFFIQLATAVAGRLRGGFGLVATVSSAFVGSVNGSAVSNVMTTGCVTIPAMKRAGYPPKVAGAIEALASTGGLILPPVMGATAFVMAEYLGVSYFKVCLIALVPALMYYLSVGLSVYLYATRERIPLTPSDEIPRVKDVLRKDGILILPFVVLVLTLYLGYSAIRAGQLAVASAVLVALTRAENRKRLKNTLLKSLADSGAGMGGIVSVAATAGLLVGTINGTGIGGVLSGVLVDISHGSQLLLLASTTIMAVILGMSVSGTATYVLVATLLVPALTATGIVLNAAHYFAYYWASIAMITPPVALAAYAASALCGAPAFDVGWTACYLGIGTLVTPFTVIWRPALTLIGYSPLQVAEAIYASLLGVVCLSAGAQGYLLRPLSRVERIAFVIISGILLAPGWQTDLLGTVLLGAMLVWQMRTRKTATQSLTLARKDAAGLERWPQRS